MADKAYQYMNWREIEDLIYGEERFPRTLLMPRKVKEGVLYQCFFPSAKEVKLVETESGKKHTMKAEDDAGYFAVLLRGKEAVPHSFLVDGTHRGNPYAFPSMLSDERIGRIKAGISEEAYRELGSHRKVTKGVEGVFFAVWAPEASRVSVVGDFNGWNGLACPMEFHEESGIYELFIPGLSHGTVYKYEIRTAKGDVYMRPDPYAHAYAFGEEPVSVVADLGFSWSDQDYMEARKKACSPDERAISIYEFPLAAHTADDGSLSFRDLAKKITDHARSMHYTHVEFTPVMEYEDDASGGYHTTGYFAPTSRFGNAADLKYLINALHMNGIGVILDWTPAQFSQDLRWMAAFDGSCLYEHLDPRQGIHPLWGTKLFNHMRPEVRSFLLSSAMFWLREFHADGLRLDGCATMLRQDYGRPDGQWIPNLYGSCENLDGIDFLKTFTQIVKKDMPESLLILEESVDFPDTTESTSDGGLGFDFEWNLHFTRDLIDFLGSSPEGKQEKQFLLQNLMLYQYYRKPVLSLSRGIGKFDSELLRSRIYGGEEEREAALRAVYVYMFTHPGKKMLTEGEDTDAVFFGELNRILCGEKALFELDAENAGFEWVHAMDPYQTVLAILRKGRSPSDRVLAVFNFSDEAIPEYVTGVPCEGTYRELLNTDDVRFGGSGCINTGEMKAGNEPADERDYSIRLKLAPLSASILRLEPGL